MVLVHGLLVILDSRRFSSVEVRRFVGIYTMGELKLIGLVEIHRQVVRRQLARGTPANKEIIICAHQFSSGEGAIPPTTGFLFGCATFIYLTHCVYSDAIADQQLCQLL